MVKQPEPPQALNNDSQKAQDSERIHLDACLYPYRSLSQRGFRRLIGFIAFVLLIPAFFFASIGAWPILGFAGLDLWLIYWAFKANYAAAKEREHILITQTRILITKWAANGKQQKFAFNPYWARLKTKNHEEAGMTYLAITSHGETLEIGTFLNPNDRESLFGALTQALSKSKCAQG